MYMTSQLLHNHQGWKLDMILLDGGVYFNFPLKMRRLKEDIRVFRYDCSNYKHIPFLSDF